MEQLGKLNIIDAKLNPMDSKPMLAVFAGLSLLLPMVSFDVFAIEHDRRMPTAIELDFIEQCRNTVQCNARVFTGDTVTFTGALTDHTGRPVPNKEVRVVALIPTPEIIVLTRGTTNLDGTFTVEWTAKLSKQKTAFDDVTRQFQVEGLEVFAEFPGDASMAPSRSNKLSMTVTVNSIHTYINSDKLVYREGDSVVLFIAFIDSNDEFVDPDNIRATWNNRPIQLEQRTTGSYTFTIDDIERRHQQIIIVPEKQGHNINVAYLTITVMGSR